MYGRCPRLPDNDTRGTIGKVNSIFLRTLRPQDQPQCGDNRVPRTRNIRDLADKSRKGLECVLERCEEHSIGTEREEDIGLQCFYKRPRGLCDIRIRLSHENTHFSSIGLEKSDPARIAQILGTLGLWIKDNGNP